MVVCYSHDPSRKLRVLRVVDEFNYEIQLEPTKKVHTYVQGGTSDPGTGNYRVDRIISDTVFTVIMATQGLTHTYVGGGTVSSVFAQQVQEGLNLHTRKCGEDVKDIYLAIAHDISRGGNMKCVDAAKLYYDAVGQYKHIAGLEVEQTVDVLEYSTNIVRCLINNVTWGGVPRGYLTKREKKNLVLPTSAKTSVVSFHRPIDVGAFTTKKKQINGFEYDKVTGIATVSTTTSHDLVKYNAVALQDIEFRCTNSPRITTNIFPDGTQGEIFEVMEPVDDRIAYTVSNAVYENTTGKMVVTTSGANTIPVGSNVKLSGLIFECDSSGSPVQLVYPDKEQYRYEVLRKPSDTTLEVNVGISTIVHTFIPGVGYTVKEDPTKFKVHVGTVSFPHVYVGGGSVWRREPFL